MTAPTREEVARMLHRLRRKTIAGQPVFPTPLEGEAANMIESLAAERDELEAKLFKLALVLGRDKP